MSVWSRPSAKAWPVGVQICQIDARDVEASLFVSAAEAAAGPRAWWGNARVRGEGLRQRRWGPGVRRMQ